ncbi:hypothetical protein HYY75_05570 [bacterium]|nr:hypothetical protein [bacterium]
MYPGEAIGTLQFTVKAALKKNGKDAASCTLVRHHDFRITSMVSKKGLGRSRYAPNFLLDYLLFVRHGLREFKESAGQSLNNNAGIVFKQDSSNPDNNNVWGKIFFGETEDPSGSNFVFLNLTEKFKELVPQFTPNPKVLKELGYDGVTKLIPRIEDKVSAGEKEIMEKVKDP